MPTLISGSWADGELATKSLRMLGRDGRQYVFRAVDKTVERRERCRFRETNDPAASA
jgi:hypothetical protein